MKLKPPDEMIAATLPISIRSDGLSRLVLDVVDAVIWEQDAQKVADRLEILGGIDMAGAGHGQDSVGSVALPGERIIGGFSGTGLPADEAHEQMRRNGWRVLVA